MNDAPAATPPIVPTDGLVVARDVRLKPGTYILPSGMRIAADGITLDGGGAVLIGVERRGSGILVEGRKDVTIRNVRLREFRHGIRARDCERLRIADVQITSTAEVAANTVFLDIWLPAGECYGGGILLERVSEAVVEACDLQHQMCGLLAYGCSRLTARRNNASYCSGFGFYLSETCDSLFEANWADYCCRYEPRGEGYGHMGADAAGFVIVRRSCRNVFRGNYARLGGDGFFLAGMTPTNEPQPCDDNLFEGNDGSLSPNIAFEATFSARNAFRENKADRCNYGFWLGFSRDCLIENNRMVMNRQAGIAVENGCGFTVRGNSFQRNGHGVLLWSQLAERWYDLLPERRTCHDWTIVGNVFTRNDAGICIAADRDHGIRPMPADRCGRAELRPHDIVIRGNDLQDNRVGIALHNTDRTLIEANTIHRNVECNIRREDDRETTVRNNLGAAGGYL